MNFLFESLFGFIFIVFLFGPLMYQISTGTLSFTEKFLDKVWLRPYAKVDRRGLIFRIRITILMCRFRAMLPFLHCLVGILLILPLGQIDPSIPVLVIFPYMIGFWVMPLSHQSNHFDEALPKFNLMMAITAAKRLVEFAPVGKQRRLLVWITGFPEAHIKIAAINGFMEKTEDWAIENLQMLRYNPSSLVQKAAEEAIELVEGILNGNGIRSVLPLEELCAAYQASLDEIPGIQSSAVLKRYEKARIGVDQTRLANQIDDIIYSQLALREAYPNVYCKQCFSSTEEESFREWKWIRCKRCLDVQQLIPGVTSVIGEIGGVKDWTLDKEILRIGIWDTVQRKATKSEIDALHVYPGGEFDYDWAISAAVQMIQNQVNSRIQQVPVTIHGKLNLSQNTQHLLRSLDHEVKFD
jgi:hypothetical protein